MHFIFDTHKKGEPFDSPFPFIYVFPVSPPTVGQTLEINYIPGIEYFDINQNSKVKLKSNTIPIFLNLILL